ncbi:MAG: lipoyl(octanoyl) transferase LipB [Alphaproteobacteria bacterium]|nr:lipoyl(octanoyl) transferase LipB [Alphaproteobacteria bacterium]
MTRVLQLEGLTPYAPAHALQEALVDARRAGDLPDVLLLLEHAETITVGRREVGLEGVIAPGGVPVVRIERGGEATWHGPGQLVAYPIVALDGPRRDVHGHLRALEQAVIALLANHGVQAGRDPRNAGVWVAGRKICSVGIAVRQWVAWHGLALNLTSDPAGFARIRPCGFDAGVMTRLADHVAACPEPAALAPTLAAHLVASLALPPVTRTVHARLADADAVADLVDALRD